MALGGRNPSMYFPNETLYKKIKSKSFYYYYCFCNLRIDLESVQRFKIIIIIIKFRFIFLIWFQKSMKKMTEIKERKKKVT